MGDEVEKTGTIYALYDPRDPEKRPRYVGQTQVGLRKKLEKYICNAYRHGNPVNKWICGLLADGARPEINALEEVSIEEINKFEIDYIDSFRSEFGDLLNIRRGGGVCREEENREKRRQSCLGKKHSPESVEKMRLAGIGKKLSIETREKIRMANVGKKHTPESIEKMKNQWTPEKREKMRETWTPERRSARSQFMKLSMVDYHATEGTCQKLRDAWTPERRAKQAQVARMSTEKRRAAKLAALSCENVETEAHARAQGE